MPETASLGSLQTGTVVAILAAGLSRRFGAGKLDAQLDGRALGLWALNTVRQLQLPFFMVVGQEHPQFLGGIGEPVDLVTNPEPERGLGSSLALAAAHARRLNAAQLLVCLGDMPFLRLATLLELIARTPANGIAASVYLDGALGPPACFAAAQFQNLERLEGDSGARRLLQASAGVVPVPVDPGELRDVDTPADLAEISRL